MGSLEAAKALINEDKRIHAWAPASQIYQEFFFREWEKKYSRNPVLKEANLALTPMVFLMWQSRYDQFIRKYKTLNFASLTKAVSLGNWEAIANKPEWGAFRFGFADPMTSNSGLAVLLSMAHEYFKSPLPLNVDGFSDPGFKNQIQLLRKHNPVPIKEGAKLTERMMLTGPSSYDVIFTYESLATEFLKDAEGRWEPMHVTYPIYNIWNENPYYVLDVPWSNPQQRDAADKFLAYLLAESSQKELMQHGFRPGNIQVPVNFANSPFEEFSKLGLGHSEGTTVDPPQANTAEALLKNW